MAFVIIDITSKQTFVAVFCQILGSSLLYLLALLGEIFKSSSSFDVSILTNFWREKVSKNVMLEIPMKLQMWKNDELLLFVSYLLYVLLLWVFYSLIADYYLLVSVGVSCDCESTSSSGRRSLNSHSCRRKKSVVFP